MKVGSGAKIRSASVDKGVIIAPKSRVVNPDYDRQRCTVSAGGVVIIGRGEKVVS